MPAKTTQQFIEEKKANFVKFMFETFSPEESSSQVVKEHLDILDSMSVSDFVCYVQQYITPHSADSYDKFIAGLCVTYSHDIASIDPANLNKVRRYLDLFSSVCSAN